DQGSYSVALPNGDLEVVFNNGNTPGSVNHTLGVHCSPSGSSSAGTAHFNCAAPVKVGDDVATGGAGVRIRPRPGGVHSRALHPHERLSADHQGQHPEQSP